jgi:hypothetical protein
MKSKNNQTLESEKNWELQLNSDNDNIRGDYNWFSFKY